MRAAPIISRRGALFWLLLQSLSTTIGYALYAMFFHGYHWLVIVLWMYITVTVYYVVRFPYILKAVLIAKAAPYHVLWLTVTTIGYWYAFWYGLSLHPGQAAVALGFLSLMIFCTPLGLALFTREKVPSEPIFWIAASLVILSIFMMKLGGNIEDALQESYWASVADTIYLDSIVLFTVVVAMQASNAVCRSRLSDHKSDLHEDLRKSNLLVNDKLPFNAPLSVAYLLSLTITMALILIDGGKSDAAVRISDWGVISIGVFGFLVPTLVVNHLVYDRGMAAHLVEPWLAIRPLQFLIISYLIYIAFDSVCPGWREEGCFISTFAGQVPVNTKLADETGTMFWAGAVMSAVAFVVMMWKPFSRSDGFAAQRSA